MNGGKIFRSSWHHLDTCKLSSTTSISSMITDAVLPVIAVLLHRCTGVTIMLISSTLPPKIARLGPVGGVHQGQVQRGEKRADRGTITG